MKKSLLALAVVTAALAACVSTSTQPPDVAKIQTACAADAAIRPSVTAMLAVPGLATPEQAGAVLAARAVIDPVCANPAGAQQAAVAGLAGATAQVLAVYIEIKSRRPPAASAPQ